MSHKGTTDWTPIAEVLRRSTHIAITSHIDPDADNVGSCLALRHGLQALGKNAQVYLADKVPSVVQFLPGSGEIIILGRGSRNMPVSASDGEVLVVLDCEPERTGGIIPEIPVTMVNIDHHRSNRTAGALIRVVPDAAATGELVAELLDALGVQLTREIATCLLAAIVGDTGSFAYSNTAPYTHRLAARLLEAGANTELVHQQLFETYSWGYAKLLCKILERLERSDDGRIAWISVPLELSEEIDLANQDSESFIRYARIVDGVEVALFIREIQPGTTKVSFRSRGEIDVRRIAEVFGGGGHQKAAGCTIDAPLERAEEQVLRAVSSQLVGSTGKE